MHREEPKQAGQPSRSRNYFPEEKLKVLEERFRLSVHLSPEEAALLAEQLNESPEQAILQWFVRRRTRARKGELDPERKSKLLAAKSFSLSTGEKVDLTELPEDCSESDVLALLTNRLFEIEHSLNQLPTTRTATSSNEIYPDFTLCFNSLLGDDCSLDEKIIFSMRNIFLERVYRKLAVQLKRKKFLRRFDEFSTRIDENINPQNFQLVFGGKGGKVHRDPYEQLIRIQFSQASEIQDLFGDTYKPLKVKLWFAGGVPKLFQSRYKLDRSLRQRVYGKSRIPVIMDSVEVLYFPLTEEIQLMFHGHLLE
ncbi:hypothetical protein K493DRAFT_404320 [Basidiobolus meristosporus CBS 931.73]|uniref:Homeobox domain-containing protein n=1 Tax=Basidiobolus meristosporus CBS 931.73 TaxID=1314790 RepID=A0A1Y1Z5J2_9FUNG|nr:hypothetical protein K493DRAFT_404320 [Basidiobolus meristosporus CBS 931.73]|eukprot:ORY05541.1 hypothetical protein K493DRAFT_404320 [Basidiobolus meristosporus CBS 931.73]